MEKRTVNKRKYKKNLCDLKMWAILMTDYLLSIKPL